MYRQLGRLFIAILLVLTASPADARDADLAEHFGFDSLEVVKIGRFAGPITVGDVNSDGLSDLIVVNNFASRIEIHYQKAGATPDDVETRPLRTNEFPPHWRFRRENLPVVHRVAAVIPHDFDGDGLVDLIYGGTPAEIVFMRQTSPGVFSATRRHRIRKLTANRDGLFIADVVGDAAPEVLGLVDGGISVWPMDGDAIGQPQQLAAGDTIVAMLLDDFDGDGRTDICGVLPEDPAPLRIWFSEDEDGKGVIGPQTRFEMAAIREATPFRLPGDRAARLAVLELSSKRLVLYRVDTEAVEAQGDRDAAIEVRGFTDAGKKKRSHAIIDVDGDGMLDLVVTDSEANALVLYRQQPGRGLQFVRSFPSLREMTYLAAGNVDDDPSAELFVLSDDEGVVGRIDVREDGTLTFPRPLPLSNAHTPTALNLVDLDDGPHLAVVSKDGRDYVVSLLHMDGTTETVELGKLSRSPETLVALDADQDGSTDLLLFTKEKPMMMLRATDDGYTLMESKEMGQYGLVKAAQAENTAVFDVDGDGAAELLIATDNFVRAVRYENEPGTGVSPGWQVVEQVNARDRSSDLVSVTVMGDRIAAADKANSRLVVFSHDAEEGWSELEALNVRGFDFDAIHAGSFAGKERGNILALGDDGFAVVQLEGERIVLKEFASWRSSEERRVHHELGAGDVNSDGFTDLIALDAGEQMCDIFTFTETGRLLFATGFQVFESRLFSGGDPREYQPSQVIVVDVTGDGAEDLVMIAHDRVLVYPQMTEPAG